MSNLADKLLEDGPELEPDFGCQAIATFIQEHPEYDREDFFDYVAGHNRCDRDSGELQDVPMAEIERLAQDWKTQTETSSSMAVGSAPIRGKKKRRRKKPALLEAIPQEEILDAGEEGGGSGPTGFEVTPEDWEALRQIAAGQPAAPEDAAWLTEAGLLDANGAPTELAQQWLAAEPSA